MTTPRATIRLQFNRDFTFDHAAEIVDYLSELGISHIYASPIAAAQAGSSHGYDVVDPTVVSPELGGMEGLRRLSQALRARQMGLIIDIVPNHMAACPENRWWWDVLKHGRASRYASYFDIDWDDPDPALKGKILLPTLGGTLDDSLARDQLSLEMDDARGGPVCRYFDHSFPIDPATTPGVDLASLTTEDKRTLLRDLLDRQNYRLADWREAATRINWRRFFDINQLVALRMESKAVFDDYHRLVLALFQDQIIDGVRVDHVDGLADPRRYCRMLRASLASAGRRGKRADAAYIVVEKILDHDECLSTEWGVDGTTGYDFMDHVAAVLHEPQGEHVLTALWIGCSNDARPFHELAREARREIVDRLFPKQTATVAALLRDAYLRHSGEEMDIKPLRSPLIELLSAFKRYRLYGDADGFSPGDTKILLQIANDAASFLTDEERVSLIAVVEALSAKSTRHAEFAPAVARFQQLSATLAAKAIEDTAFYRYGRLISRNEVGSDPGRFAISPDEFHERCIRSQAAFPHAMLATATHDHKRGEDGRVRLAILSEIAEDWSALVRQWTKCHPIPDRAIQAMIYQTIVGAWPLEFDPRDEAARVAFHDRVSRWLIKALREAKQATSWYEPDQAFEQTYLAFLKEIFDPRSGKAFLDAMQALIQRIAPAGAVNALSQTLLRLTAPGVPDLYQGADFWDFSLVDPDNRDIVDFRARQDGLSAASPGAILQNWQSGRIKQHTIARALAFRRRCPALFTEGRYRPVAVAGRHSRNVVAFLRENKNCAALVIVPRCCVALLGGSSAPLIPQAAWGETLISIPMEWSDAAVHDMMLDRPVVVGKAPGIGTLLADWPVGLFRLEAPQAHSGR